MTKTEKERLTAKAIKLAMQNRRPNLDELRTPLAIMIIEGQTWGKMEKLVKDEGINYSAGQLKYYFKKHPLSAPERMAAGEHISKEASPVL